jgi:hypothetical protein
MYHVVTIYDKGAQMDDQQAYEIGQQNGVSSAVVRSIEQAILANLDKTDAAKETRDAALEEAAVFCFEFSHYKSKSLEAMDALQEACGVIRTRLKRGSLAIALDYAKRNLA